MTDTTSVQSGAAGDLPDNNRTRASITGKVPDAAKPGGRTHAARRGGKLPGHRRAHVRKLKKSGVISERAAARNGL